MSAADKKLLDSLLSNENIEHHADVSPQAIRQLLVVSGRVSDTVACDPRAP
jgi:hypothetical protein